MYDIFILQEGSADHIFTSCACSLQTNKQTKDQRPYAYCGIRKGYPYCSTSSIHPLFDEFHSSFVRRLPVIHFDNYLGGGVEKALFCGSESVTRLVYSVYLVEMYRQSVRTVDKIIFSPIEMLRRNVRELAVVVS